MTTTDFESRQFISKYKELRYEWAIFVRIPLVLICIPNFQLARHHFSGEIEFIFYCFLESSALRKIEMMFNSSSVINSGELGPAIENFRKNKLELKILADRWIRFGSAQKF